MIARFRSRVTAALTAFATVAAGVLTAPPQAHAIYGTADIKPIESNIAAKFWASATASSGSTTTDRPGEVVVVGTTALAKVTAVVDVL